MGPRRRTGRPAPPRPLLLLLLLALSLVLRGADGTVTVTGTGRQYHSRPASFGYEMEYGAFLGGLMLAEGRLIDGLTLFFCFFTSLPGLGPFFTSLRHLGWRSMSGSRNLGLSLGIRLYPVVLVGRLGLSRIDGSAIRNILKNTRFP